MDEKIVQKLTSQRYSVKQMIAYFIFGYLNTEYKEEFKNRISTIPPNEVLNDLASQTWGLIRINEKNQKRIKIAVILDLVGLVWFIAILVFVMIAQYI